MQDKNEELSINLYSGASLGETDRPLSEQHAIFRRMPYQSEPILRRQISQGDVVYIDEHLSQMAEWVRSGTLLPIDYAIIEATAILKMVRLPQQLQWEIPRFLFKPQKRLSSN